MLLDDLIFMRRHGLHECESIRHLLPRVSFDNQCDKRIRGIKLKTDIYFKRCAQFIKR